MSTNPVLDFESAPIAPTGLPTAHDSNEDKYDDEKNFSGAADVSVDRAGALDSEDAPTDEEMLTLRKVSAPMPWVAIAMCLIEFAERASYYGSKGPFNNFINNPLPPGSKTGAVPKNNPLLVNTPAGALGLGSVDASALTNLFTFLAYVVPIFGGIIADTKWGRFKTICWGTGVGAVAHFLLVVPAIPSVISHPSGSLGAFIISIVVLAFAAGFIKPSLGPMLCDQSPVKAPTIKITPSGERVIVDPSRTVQRYLMIFYWCINVGAFFALATSYAERDVGFWLAYLLPGILYMMMPIVLVFAAKRLYKAPPQGSVVVEAYSVIKKLLSDGGLRRMWRGGDDFWERAKPSFIAQRDGTVDTTKVFWDDRFVDEIKQTIHACQVFALIPIFQLCDGGFGNELNDMSSAMILNGVPNDLISNWNSLAIIVFTPILTWGLYPYMDRIGYPLKPMARMCIGFMLASITCVICVLVQWRVYATSPCGRYASTCTGPDGASLPSSVSLWWQVPIYTLPAIGELFVNVTSYELAYTRAPARMKGLVFALALFNSAVAAALGLAVSNAIQDPYLMWSWTALAVASFLAGISFPTYFKHLNDPSEDFANVERQAGHQQPDYVREHEGVTAKAQN